MNKLWSIKKIIFLTFLIAYSIDKIPFKKTRMEKLFTGIWEIFSGLSAWQTRITSPSKGKQTKDEKKLISYEF